jgi:hypothetical protein
MPIPPSRRFRLPADSAFPPIPPPHTIPHLIKINRGKRIFTLERTPLVVDGPRARAKKGVG